jgi:hypothetical protein
MAGGTSGGAGASGSGGTGAVTRACCRGGTQALVNGAWGPCEGAYISPETCNGFDDDCDGQIDEIGSVTCGVGACATTVPACSGGRVNACVPGTPAAGPDGCDGIDNDCDGAVDEDCDGCLHVAPDGDDDAAIATEGAVPFQSVPVALDFVAAHPAVTQHVCVAAGAACGAAATYAGAPGAELTLPNGIELLGGYESTTWTRCANSTTTLAPQTARGVVFPASVQAPTVLDGFTIVRFADPTLSTAVTLDGARGAVLSALELPQGPSTQYDYGVNVVNGAEGTLLGSRVEAGTGSVEVVGVRVVGSRLRIEAACPVPTDPVTGHCATTCSDQGPGISIVHQPTGFITNVTRVNAVLFQDAAGSRIDRSAICESLNSVGTFPPETAAVKVEGSALDLVLRANAIVSRTGNDGMPKIKPALSLADCGGAAPWIFDNERIEESPQSTAGSADAVLSSGDCHPIIESNALVSVTPTNWSGSPQGAAVHCTESGNVASGCVIAGNTLSFALGTRGSGASGAEHVQGTGVHCEGQSCTRIEGNTVYGVDDHSFGSSPQFGLSGTGITLESAAFVADNDVVGVKHNAHCAVAGVGIVAGPGHARLENNRVLAIDQQAFCSSPALGEALGLEANGALDVSSNYVSSSGFCFPPSSSGFDPPASPDFAVSLGAPGGVYRNNIFEGGPCGIAFAETSAQTDPQIFEHNALDPMTYVDEGTNTLTAAAAVDSLPDMTSSGTLAGACAATADHHLSAGSACIDAGTSVGAPAFDMDGQIRDSKPDIGPDEYVP